MTSVSPPTVQESLNSVQDAAPAAVKDAAPSAVKDAAPSAVQDAPPAAPAVEIKKEGVVPKAKRGRKKMNEKQKEEGDNIRWSLPMVESLMEYQFKSLKSYFEDVRNNKKRSEGWK